MKTYLLSLGAGLLVGVVYSLLDVRSRHLRSSRLSDCWASCLGSKLCLSPNGYGPAIP